MTRFTRRQFLIQSAAIAGLAGMPPAFRARTVRDDFASSLTLDMLHHSHFQPHLGSRFRLRGDDGSTTELELTEINARPAALTPAAEGMRACFSLVFRAPPQVSWSQRIYALEHPSLGRLDIFLVPIGPDDHGQLYEAVFN